MAETRTKRPPTLKQLHQQAEKHAKTLKAAAEALEAVHRQLAERAAEGTPTKKVGANGEQEEAPEADEGEAD